MDAATRHNLEITQSFAGHAEHTLAVVMDRTATAMGSRLLRRWLGRPLRDRHAVRDRHASVAELIDGKAWQPLRDELAGIGDLERILAPSPWAAPAPETLPCCGTPWNACPRYGAQWRGWRRRYFARWRPRPGRTPRF